MKILILPECFCVGEYLGGNIHVGNCTLKDCCLEKDLERQLEHSKTQCLSKQVPEKQQFFFGVSLYQNGVAQKTSYQTGQFENCVLKPSTHVGGDRLRLNDGDHVLVFSYKPTDLSFLPEHSCSILTSDAVLILEKDQYIGFKDGHIDVLSAKDLLEQLKDYAASSSPSYQKINIEPVKSRPKRPRQGTIIYNKIINKLELYDGKSWRTIKLEDSDQ
jgi:hypothetical protein